MKVKARFVLLIFCLLVVPSHILSSDKFDFIKTEKQYFRLFDAADDSTFRHEFELEFLLLLTDEQKAAYQKLKTLNEKKVFIRHYWDEQNPNPLLPQNDRLLDHLKRRLFARKHFPLTEPPYFDDRGKYYIKYGNPKFRFRDIGGQRSMESLVTVPFKYYTVIPNESWSYVNITPDYVVHFMEKSGVYVEIASLRNVIMDSKRRGRVVWYWFDLLKRRFWMSSRIAETVTDIEAIETDIMLSNGGRRATVGRIGDPIVRVSDQMFRDLKQAQHEENLIALNAPTVIYSPVNAFNNLDFTYDIAQFKGMEGKTHLEVMLKSPVKQLIDNIDLPNVVVNFSCLVSNANLDSLAISQISKKIPVQLSAYQPYLKTGSFLTYDITPQDIEIAFQIQNMTNNEIGFGQKNITIKDFSADTLMISDVEYLTQLNDTRINEVLPVVEKEGLKFFGYPFEKIHKSTPLFCYFEIYNLKRAVFGNEFEISYKVVKDRSKGGLLRKVSKAITNEKEASIEITEKRKIIANDSNEIIQLDLNKLEKGPYWLVITVRDPDNPSKSVSTIKELFVKI